MEFFPKPGRPWGNFRKDDPGAAFPGADPETGLVGDWLYIFIFKLSIMIILQFNILNLSCDFNSMVLPDHRILKESQFIFSLVER
jgi:hypothetical protein